MRRIMIFGLPGSGKTRFAIELSQLLHLPIYHLDRYFFVENWKERDYEEFLSIQKSLVEKKQWIIDGNATRSLEMRYQNAEIAIYFRYNRLLCLWRICKRIFFPDPFEDLPEGCIKSISWKLVRYLWSFHKPKNGS